MLLTRSDAAIFIVALQRAAHKATKLHFKRLNAVVRWMQKCPQKLIYKALPGKWGSWQLLCISDAAFKKEEDAGHALKGGLFALASCTSDAQPTHIVEMAWRKGTSTVQVIEMVSRRLRNVTRSTFSSETFAANDCVDQGILLCQILHEVVCGACTALEARTLREEGGFKIPMVLVIDAKSVYAAATAGQVKIPAEKSLLSHLQYLRELLDRGVLRWIIWADTRDMVADGLTKGVVERKALHDAMKGLLDIKHEHEIWSSPLLKVKKQLIL